MEETADHLPVYTCTFRYAHYSLTTHSRFCLFSVPEGMEDSLGVSIEKGDVPTPAPCHLLSTALWRRWSKSPSPTTSPSHTR